MTIAATTVSTTVTMFALIVPNQRLNSGLAGPAARKSTSRTAEKSAANSSTAASAHPLRMCPSGARSASTAAATNNATRHAAIVVHPPQLPQSSAWISAAAKLASAKTTTSTSDQPIGRSLKRRAPSQTNPGTSTKRLLPTATETNPPTPDDQAM